MHRAVFWCLALPIAAIVCAGPEAEFRSGISVVLVDAQVVDARGKPIGGLKREDFVISDDGDPQTVLSFAHDEMPLDLLLLLDVSGSMHAAAEALASVARLSLDHLQADDRVAVMRFGVKAGLLHDLTSDRKAIEDVLVSLPQQERFAEGTHLTRAAREGAHYFQQQPPVRDRRRLVLMLTDNIGWRSAREATVVREFWEADASLSALVFDGGMRTDLLRFQRMWSPIARLTLTQIDGVVRETGGEMLKVRLDSDFVGEAIDRARMRYTLSFRAPDSTPGEHHRIRVELTRAARSRYDGSRVRARHGYIAR